MTLMRSGSIAQTQPGKGRRLGPPRTQGRGRDGQRYRKGRGEEKGGLCFMPNGLYCLCGGGPGEQSGGAWKGRRGSEHQGEVTKGLLTGSKKGPVTHERLLSNSEVGNAPWWFSRPFHGASVRLFVCWGHCAIDGW